ncbi:MAG: DUF4197 domain-containing protein [Geminicoccaceae bacterium]
MLRTLLLATSLTLPALFATTGPANAQGKLFDAIGKAVDSVAGSTGGQGSALDSATIADGLREALTVGTGRVVDYLGAPNGFLEDSRFHIPLPGILENARTALSLAGLSGLADDLELRMNRAAEAAVPVARGLFTDAIAGLTFEDVMAIYNGPADSATRYLEKATGPGLETQMRPIIEQALNEAGAVQAFDQLAGEVASLPLVGAVKANLVDHVLGYADNALFTYLASEEEAIRQNPAQRTTELLQQVFGN